MMRYAPFKIAGILALCAGVTIYNIRVMPERYAIHAEVENIYLAPLRLNVRSSGSLEAKDSTTIKAAFDGSLLMKQFREGQTVQKGQLLAELGRERIRLDHQAKIDALQNAKDDLARARRDLKIQKELFAKEAVAYSAVEDAQRSLVKLQQAVAGALEGYRIAQEQWNSNKIIAPITGTVVKDWLGEDKAVTNGKEIVTVADVSEYTVKAHVDELDIKRVHEGQGVTVTVQIFPQSPLTGWVKEIGSQSDGNGLPQVPVIYGIAGTGGLPLRPKLTVEADIFTGITEPILSVPLTAIANADGDAHVWVLGKMNRIHSVKVVLGRSNADRVEVTQGLLNRTRICKNAEPEFAEGMKVVTQRRSFNHGSGSRTHVLISRLSSKRVKQDGKSASSTKGGSIFRGLGDSRH